MTKTQTRIYRGVVLAIAVIAGLIIGCTDARMGKLTSLGSPASVQCWSGEKLIYEGRSTGKVISEENSDGYFFRDAETDEMMEVSGNCIITYKD